MSVPDRFDTEPVIGWRYWYVLTNQVDLTSPIQATYAWPRGTRAAATCRAHIEPAPSQTCLCGFYAKAKREHLEVPAGSDQVTVVIGQVSLWGTVLEHEKGWRAQYAYPYALFVQAESGMINDYEELARRLGAVYQVDAEVELSHGYWQANRASAHRNYPSQ